MARFLPFAREGVGIHTGAPCAVRAAPAEPGSGVVFATARGDVPLRPEAIAPASRRATDLAAGRARVGTVEHLAAALAWFGVRDARVDVDGPEIPILDGSAAPWVAALAAAGAEPGPAFVRVRAPIRVEGDGAWAEMAPLPAETAPSYSVELDFGGAPIGPRAAAFRPLVDDFTTAIAPARTFALAAEVAALRAQGLARGGSLDCALVIGDGGPLNPDGMRFPDEPARHKLLDAIGDLSLLGGLPWARVVLFRPSHELNRALVAAAAGLAEEAAP
jgi:UDP-3-O-[3-hydroxymyristoyl] N-acetylglucosamine deacetylase